MALDVFIDKLKEVIADLKLMLRESFMMNIFAKFLTDLLPMKEYWNHIFKKDKVRMICRHTGAMIVHLVGVKDEAFVPKYRTNRLAAPRVIELDAVAFKIILDNMMIVKKVVHLYLSCYGLKSSWLKCPDSDSIKKATLVLEATTDYSESSLGGTTHEINKFGGINQHNASAINDGRRNGYWKRSVSKKEEKKGEFNCIPFATATTHSSH